jgi:hypothetical protein
MSEDVSNVHQLIEENENIINTDNREMRDMGSIGVFSSSRICCRVIFLHG